MNAKRRGMIIGSLLGVLICGVAGGLAAWMLVNLLGMTGVFGAIIAAIVGMIVATVLWVAGSALLRALGWVR